MRNDLDERTWIISSADGSCSLHPEHKPHAEVALPVGRKVGPSTHIYAVASAGKRVTRLLLPGVLWPCLCQTNNRRSE